MIDADSNCIELDNATYGPGSWLYIGTKPVTYIGLDGTDAWYIHGHVHGGWVNPDALSLEPQR